MTTYDVLILGGGPGGYVAAIKAAQNGLKTALVEKEVVGGICLNHGCIPTKALLKSAKMFKQMKHAKDYGITLEGTLDFDWTSMLKRKDGVVKKLTTGVAGLLKKNGVTVYNGYGEVLSPNKVKVNDETLETKNLIIATGASPFIPPIDGLKESFDKGVAVTSRELLQIKEAPKSLVIIGGGVIGVEFATIFNALGTKVTIIEMMESILPPMDEDIKKQYTKILKRDGIDILTKAEVTSVKNNKVTYQHENKSHDITADTILVAVGMRANTKGLEKLNLKMDRSAILTNEKLETNVPHVYAIGDVNGKYMLAHVASHEGIIAVENILGHEGIMHYDRVPNAVYGSPEVAMIGKTERELKENDVAYKASTFPILANGKSLADGQSDGFIKLLVSEKYKEILGAHILAYNASDLIAELGVTMTLEGTAYELTQTIHPHPTLSEIVMEAAEGAIGKTIHI